MNNTENPGTSSWTRIQSGVRETERLIGQKKYNLAMIKARQTLEFMVKCLCERTGAADGSLIDMIDSLYEEQAISKTTFEHYHKIRTIGNKAIHEEDNSAYNANQAYHLLSQEVHAFASDHNDRGDHRRNPSSAMARSQGMPPQRQSTPQRRSSSNYSHRRRAHSSGPSFELRSLIKPILLLAIIVVLIFIIKMIRPSKPAKDTSSAPVVTTQVSTSPDESESAAKATEPAASQAPSTAAVSAAVKYKTNDTVNLRSTPDTTKDRIGVLPPDTTVEYIPGSDKKDSTGKTWCKIKHNGQEAYMVKDYLTPLS